MTSDASGRPRAVWRRLVGFLMSFVVTGSGHVLLGRWRRGLALVTAALLLLLSVPWTRIFGVAGFAVLYLTIPFDLLWIRPGHRPTLGRLLLAWVALVAALLVFRASVRTHYLEAFKIPQGGMAPTLFPGDLFFVERFRRTPRPGEVIVFRHPGEPTQDFVSRVVAVAGDRIEIRGGTIIVNGDEVPRSSAKACEVVEGFEGTWTKQSAQCSEETLGGVRHVVAHDPASPARDFPDGSDEPFVVPPASLFVVGDNRDDSDDSRSWGTVPLDHVKGTALFVWWSSIGGVVQWDRLNLSLR